MATAKINKVQTEIEKTRERITEQQARLKELEATKTELENLEIVDIVRGASIPLDSLAAILQSLKGNPTAFTSGHVDPMLGEPEITNDEQEGETE